MFKILTLCLALIAAVACSPSDLGDAGSIEIVEPYARAVMAMKPMEASQAASGGSNGAAYMIIQNHGNEPDRLMRVKGEAAEEIELHQSVTENEVTSMRPVEFLEIPSGGQAQLKPGGYHIMLIGLNPDLKVGDVIPLTLVFEKAGSIQVQAEIKTP